VDQAGIIEWIRDDAAEAVTLLSASDPDAAVPTCPGWVVRDLTQHLAGGFGGWYCFNIATPATAWSSEGLLAGFPDLEGLDHEARVAVFGDGVEEFIRLCTTLDLDHPSWSFGSTEPARWWIRRAAVELTAHLIDAAAVHGRSSSTTPDRLSEAVDEYTGLWARLDDLRATMVGLQRQPPPPPIDVPTAPAALVASDTGREWALRRGDDGRAVVAERDIDGIDHVATGSSRDLVAWLFGRPLETPLHIDGDPSVIADWNLAQKAQL
jgi:hypothetical protein